MTAVSAPCALHQYTLKGQKTQTPCTQQAKEGRKQCWSDSCRLRNSRYVNDFLPIQLVPQQRQIHKWLPYVVHAYGDSWVGAWPKWAVRSRWGLCFLQGPWHGAWNGNEMPMARPGGFCIAKTQTWTLEARWSSADASEAYGQACSREAHLAVMSHVTC